MCLILVEKYRVSQNNETSELSPHNHKKQWEAWEASQAIRKLGKGQGVKNSAFKLIQLFKYGSRKLEGTTEITWK